MSLDTPGAVTKKRQRFRARGEKIVSALLARIDRLEALAAVQSYEIAEPDIAAMRASVSERLDKAFNALGDAADRNRSKKPATPAFSFDETGA